MLRRTILQSLALPALALPGLLPMKSLALPGDADQLFSISLAQWSLHRTFFGSGLSAGFGQALASDPDAILQGNRHPLDFPIIARQEFDIDAVEYVNTFFYGHARDSVYLNELKRRADGEGVRSLLIMCDALGAIGAADPATRAQVVERHRPWLEAASVLGCHAIRVNASGSGAREEHQKTAADGLHQLAELAAPLNLDVLVENHGGLSSDGAWLAGTIALTAHSNVGSLPDFGNFRLNSRDDPEPKNYDRYLGVTELMPYARAVSAKSYDFDPQGQETTIDYRRMLRIVLDAGYRGAIGIEYEGRRLSEFEGIRATQQLLQQLRAELADSYR